MATLQNDILTLQINSLGAELCSIKHNDNDKEYIWQAHPEFWKRHSPVLFPIVGSLWNGKYMNDGEEYSMGQHGFARDMVFDLLSGSSQEISYQLESNEETLSKYPFPFKLIISYGLEQNFVHVNWEVENTGNKVMHFQIGAHPAFNLIDTTEMSKGYLGFSEKELQYMLIKEKGCIDVSEHYVLSLNEGLLPITSTLFDRDALIFEKQGISRVDLLSSDKKPYVRVHFESPLAGIWSPAGKNVPFVCIEPWYGRCDRVNYSGEFKDRDWMNHLNPNEIFKAKYSIEII
ncbi:aldose 1-epimerase family protein [Apibacter raozihei]|uniref:aldose 1-epimerase family protein n=1 Tax=Apibacter raozihei TaxID=2500547 RepID=UPI000FE2FD36|nr:aldose 1-epimerase family protein [Apibacter raozihei]